MIIRKSKLPLERMTPLDKEAELNRRKAQEGERIEVLGQESDKKAVPWVQKDVEEVEIKDKEYFWLVVELLKKAQAKKKDYFRILTQVFLHFMTKESIPKKYFIEIEANNIGIKVEIKNTHYYGAFKVCGLPSYDFRACQVLAIKLGNTVAKLKGYTRKSDGGISLPDDEDLRIYG